MLRMLVLTLCLAVLPPAARAHPHEFVDARLGFVFDDAGRLTAVSVEWRYDEFTSMLIQSDLGLNPAATDLAADQAPELQGFDMDWIEGYNGDLWPMADGEDLELGPPQPGPVTVEGGQIVSRHHRVLPQPIDPRQVRIVVQVYDPEFYIAYTIAQGSSDLSQIGCRARVFTADFDAAYARLEVALEELSAGGADIEMNFPRVGRDFADEIRIDCDDPQPDRADQAESG
jgi:polyphosphate kinase